MAGMDELELDELIARLTREFPRLAPAEVNATVREAYAESTGPIVAFVPFLVERRSRARLAARSTPAPNPAARSGSTRAPTGPTTTGTPSSRAWPPANCTATAWTGPGVRARG